ncbi:MAG TPA: hypothetical protein VMZ53_32645 [Kofleriaceae bacterium]|nr:hypothetical protein [Kofleriaceae bacterium]
MKRIARVASIALLVVGAIAAITLVAWSIYVRQSFFGPGPGRPGLRTGLELAARLGPEYLIALGAMAAGALALAYMQWRERKLAFLIGAISAALAIAGAWWGRHFIVGLEDPHFVKKSPWVQAATFVATIATVYLGALAASSLIAWLTARKSRPSE